MSGDVSRVVHVFQEEDEVSQDLHLRYWYGTVRPSEEDSDSICWCGARHIQMGKDVYAVWHVQSWNDRAK